MRLNRWRILYHILVWMYTPLKVPRWAPKVTGGGAPRAPAKVGEALRQMTEQHKGKLVWRWRLKRGALPRRGKKCRGKYPLHKWAKI